MVHMIGACFGMANCEHRKANGSGTSHDVTRQTLYNLPGTRHLQMNIGASSTVSAPANTTPIKGSLLAPARPAQTEPPQVVPRNADQALGVKEKISGPQCARESKKLVSASLSLPELLDTARSLHKTVAEMELFNELHGIALIGQSHQVLVCKALWRTCDVTVKIITSESQDVFSNMGVMEGLLSKEMRHSNIIQVRRLGGAQQAMLT